jgi:hypothetical protein
VGVGAAQELAGDRRDAIADGGNDGSGCGAWVKFHPVVIAYLPGVFSNMGHWVGLPVYANLNPIFGL